MKSNMNALCDGRKAKLGYIRMPNGGQLDSFENVLGIPCLSAAPRAVQKSARAVPWPAYGRGGGYMLCQWNAAGPRRKSTWISTFL